MHNAPTGAAFDVVLILHVGCFLVAFASVLVTGTQAWRLRGGPGSPAAESVARFFRPGINLPGRAIYAVIVLGALLVVMSQKAYDFSDPFVELGLVLWVAVVGLAETVVWPGERRLQRAVATWGDGTPPDERPPPDGEPFDVKTAATTVALCSWAVCALLIAAVVVMVDKP